MRIGFDGKFLTSNATPGAKSGNSVHAKELLCQLMALDKDTRYSVYTINGIPAFPPARNVTFHALSRGSKSAYFRYAIEYPLRLLRNPVDVMISFTTLSPFIRCKHVLFLPDISWIVHPEWLPRTYSVPEGIATRISVRSADMIIAPTEFSRSEIVRHLRVPEHKVAVVPHGTRERFLERVDTQRIETLKRKYGVPSGYILSINDIHPRKNIEGLIDAFCYMKETYGIDQKLMLVGQALWHYPTFFQKVASAKYRDDIVLTGYVPGEEILPLYQGASAFVYPSFYEGWGLQIHEAMASGVPVAVSNAASLPEVSGEAAVQFNPADSHDMGEKIYSLLSDKALAQQLISSGYDQVKKFSWQESARMTLDICRAL